MEGELTVDEAIEIIRQEEILILDKVLAEKVVAAASERGLRFRIRGPGGYPRCTPTTARLRT